MHQHYRRGIGRHGVPKNIARMNNGRIKRPAGQGHLAQKPSSGVEQQRIKMLHGVRPTFLS